MKEVIGVQFKSGGKIYDFDPGKSRVKIGDFVIVKTKQGNEIGKLAYTDKKVDEASLKIPLVKIMRKANKADIKKMGRIKEEEKEALKVFTKKIAAHKLSMEPISTKLSFDEQRLTLTFIAENRIDFRTLVRDLASHFQKSIRLTQIGPRDRAKITGGFGMCGRELCCTKFLKKFESVTTEIAREQDMAGRGSTKITGCCGRLMCCLNYELEDYRKLIKKLPQIGDTVKTPNGGGKVIGRNIIAQTVDVFLENKKTRETIPVAEIKKTLNIFRKK